MTDLPVLLTQSDNDAIIDGNRTLGESERSLSNEKREAWLTDSPTENNEQIRGCYHANGQVDAQERGEHDGTPRKDCGEEERDTPGTQGPKQDNDTPRTQGQKEDNDTPRGSQDDTPRRNVVHKASSKRSSVQKASSRRPSLLEIPKTKGILQDEEPEEGDYQHFLKMRFFTVVFPAFCVLIWCLLRNVSYCKFSNHDVEGIYFLEDTGQKIVDMRKGLGIHLLTNAGGSSLANAGDTSSINTDGYSINHALVAVEFSNQKVESNADLFRDDTKKRDFVYYLPNVWNFCIVDKIFVTLPVWTTANYVFYAMFSTETRYLWFLPTLVSSFAFLIYYLHWIHMDVSKAVSRSNMGLPVIALSGLSVYGGYLLMRGSHSDSHRATREEASTDLGDNLRDSPQDKHCDHNDHHSADQASLQKVLDLVIAQRDVACSFPSSGKMRQVAMLVTSCGVSLFIYIYGGTVLSERVLPILKNNIASDLTIFLGSSGFAESASSFIAEILISGMFFSIYMPLATKAVAMLATKGFSSGLRCFHTHEEGNERQSTETNSGGYRCEDTEMNAAWAALRIASNWTFDVVRYSFGRVLVTHLSAPAFVVCVLKDALYQLWHFGFRQQEQFVIFGLKMCHADGKNLILSWKWKLYAKLCWACYYIFFLGSRFSKAWFMRVKVDTGADSDSKDEEPLSVSFENTTIFVEGISARSWFRLIENRLNVQGNQIVDRKPRLSVSDRSVRQLSVTSVTRRISIVSHKQENALEMEFERQIAELDACEDGNDTVESDDDDVIVGSSDDGFSHIAPVSTKNRVGDVKRRTKRAPSEEMISEQISKQELNAFQDLVALYRTELFLRYQIRAVAKLFCGVLFLGVPHILVLYSVPQRPVYLGSPT